MGLPLSESRMTRMTQISRIKPLLSASFASITSDDAPFVTERQEEGSDPCPSVTSVIQNWDLGTQK